ncbi:MAG: carbohydrate-binding family 9-like protein, partial [Bacteroides sp.]
ECNCAGTILVGVGEDRDNRERASQDILNQVQRWSSLGREPFEEKIGECSWEIALIIPYSVFFKHQIEKLDNQSLKANFYKCGDELQTPHFLSWNPIDLETPNFHCPKYFGTIHCK